MVTTSSNDEPDDDDGDDDDLAWLEGMWDKGCFSIWTQCGGGIGSE